MSIRSLVRVFPLLVASVFLGRTVVLAQVNQPLVAIHDSEFTRALETMPASGPTPTGSGCTGFQWWPQDWHYFVMPETVKEALRSDGTAYTVVGDSNVISGALLTNGQPKYPIVISLASEAIRDDEIAPFTNYVAAGGFLLVGSSAFSRNTNGTSRGDFALGNQMGLHLAAPVLTNWIYNYTVTKQVDHRIDAHLPSGQLTWLMPTLAEQIPWGISPDHPYNVPHDLWCVTNTGATILVQGDSFPYLAIKQYGKGYFIYCAQFQPLMGATGFAPSMYSYLIFRRCIEWAFETLGTPIPKVSPWPYQYDAAFMVRHDLENYTNEIAAVDASAQVEFNNGAKGDYYFCTGTLRDDTPSGSTNAMVLGLRHAVTNYGATIGPHNGGLKNPNNPSLVRGQYDYWHWGTDEALDAIPPTNYPNGKAYALASVSNSFSDVEGWLAGTTNASGLRTWVQCYFNGDREDSLDIQAQLGVNIAGDQKLTPFPHWTISTKTSGKRYPFVTEPPSDWFVGGLVAQSLEPWHPPGVQTTNTLHAGIDFYYNLGALINFYCHTLANGLGDAQGLASEYVAYGANTNAHPRIWSANGVMVYQWWLQRSNVQVSASWSTNGYQTSATLNISGAVSSNTAVELFLPATAMPVCGIQVVTNGTPGDASLYRIVNGQTLRLKVGTTVTNAVVSYYSVTPTSPVFIENFDGVTAPALPSGWTTSATGAQSNWTTQTASNSSLPNAAYSIDASATGISELVSPSISIPFGTNTLSFMHYYDLDGNGTVGFDGAVLEIKIGTNAFTDILAAGGAFASNGYVAPLSSGNPLPGRSAWTGNSGGFIQTLVTLPPSASGTNVQLKWRCASDTNTALTGWRIDSVAISNTACYCCVAPNNPPAFTGTPSSATIPENVFYSVTNSATDPDGNNLFYSLVNPPTGMIISGSGVITWTPSETQGPGVYPITTVVMDSGIPSLSRTNSFTLTVSEVNSPPSFVQTPTNRTANELALMTVTNTATDPDIPANTLTYTLVSPPAGATITNGVIFWTPSEAQGPGVYPITTVVSDGTLSVTNSFNVTVSEVNTNPVFVSTPASRVVLPSVLLTVTNSATDSDIPANTLKYSLLTPPAGMTIDTNTGVISWTPTPAQDHTTNTIRTVVTDNGSPNLSATNTFTVIVFGDPVIVVSSATLVQEGCLSTNNAIDPGENVTVLFSLQNIGLGPTTNVVATLLSTNGVVLPSGAQSYGSLAPGGAAATQPFTFANTGTCGGTIAAVFQLQDGTRNLGLVTNVFTLGAQNVFSQNFDGTNAPNLPAGWTTVGGGALGPWITTNTLADTAPNAAFSADAGGTGTNELDSPPITLPNGPAQLSFRHFYFFEADNTPGNGTNAYDGGVLEIKIGTNAYVDITNAGGVFLSNGYNRKIDFLWTNPLSNHWAWSGTNSSYVTTLVSLPPAASGQTIQLRWRVGTDNGNASRGWRIDTVSVTSYACCVNGAPVLTTQTNRTIPELSLLTVTNTATDSSSRASGLTYQLLNPPSGAAIDTNGVITWTPSEAQGPGSYTLTTVVTDNGYPPLSATNSFQVTVSEVNSAPSLTVPANQTISELTTLNVSASATDTDAPPNNLFFSLVSAPSGMTIDTNTGAISWTPTETQGPSTNTVNVRVTDDGSPPMSDTKSFQVIVNEINSAPSLTVPVNQTINEGSTLNVSASATDPDIPANNLLFSLVSAPGGVTINTNTGAILWTPTETQGPSTNTITVRVTDDGSPPMSDTKSFQVIVNEVNSAPVLTVPGNQSISEGSTLNVTALATDSDIPTNTLTFSLVSAPSAMTINTNTGAISWTTTEPDGPSTNTITVRVTDNGSPPMSDTKTFNVVVNEINTAPALPPQTNLTIIGTATLVVTNTASDVDIPTNSLTYAFLAAPTNATIDTNGVITWTPAIAQVPSTNVIMTVVTDDNPWAVNAQHLSATNSFTVIVQTIHNGPTLPAQTNRSIDELAVLTVTNTATDTDIPALQLTYQLLNPPAGAAIDTNGVITWTPSEAQGPATNTITTVVTDNGQPQLSATNSFSVVVNEVNSAPTLPPQTNLTIIGTATLVVTNTASDVDVPTNSLTYAFLAAPTNATIDTNGVITWTPAIAQVPSTNVIMTVVTDDNPWAVNAQQLSATNSFTVVVQSIHTGPTLPPQTNRSMHEMTLLTVTNTASDSDIPALQLTYQLLNPPAGAAIDTNGIITWTAPAVTSSTTNAFVTVVTDDGFPPMSFTNQFFVTVVPLAGAPTILSVTYSNSTATVSWTSVAGYTYQLQYKEWLSDTNWTPVAPNIPATNTTTSMSDSVGSADQRLYRVRLIP